MEIVIFEDDKDIAGELEEKLKEDLKNIGKSHFIYIRKKTINWHKATQTKKADQYWLIDLNCETINKHNPKWQKKEQYDWFFYSLDKPEIAKIRGDIVFEDIEHGWAVAIEAHDRKIPFSFFSIWTQVYLRDEVRKKLALFLSRQDDYLPEMVELNKDRFLKYASYRKEFISYVLSKYEEISIVKISSLDWRKIRGGGLVVNRLKQINNAKIIDYFNENPDEPNPIKPHHFKGGGGGDRKKGLYAKELKPIIRHNILSKEAKKKFVECNYSFDYKWDFEGTLKSWRCPPIRAVIQDNNLAKDVERSLYFWKYECNDKVNVFSASGDLFTNFPKKPQPSTRIIIGRSKEKQVQVICPFVFSYNFKGKTINGSHMLHFWFNLPKLLYILISKVGLGITYNNDTSNSDTNEDTWLHYDEYKSIKLIFALAGGKNEKGYFFEIREENELFDGLLVMIFCENEEHVNYKYEKKFPIRASKEVCTDLIECGASWILYTNKDDKDYFQSTLCLAQKKKIRGSPFLTVNTIDLDLNLWDNINNIDPPLIAFLISAEAAPSCFIKNKFVPLVKDVPLEIKLTNDEIRSFFYKSVQNIKVFMEKLPNESL